MIELTPQQQQFVDAQVSAGDLPEPDKAIGAALAILQQWQTEYEHLQSAIGQIERGKVQPLDLEEIKRRGRQRRAAEST